MIGLGFERGVQDLGGSTQHRQSAQLALLEEACGRHTPVTVERCGATRPDAQAAELMRVEGPRLLLIGRLQPGPQGFPGRVEIGFDHEQSWLSFRSEVLPEPPPGEDIWAVTTPLRLVRRDARAQQRIALPEYLPVTVRVTGMHDRTVAFVGKLQNVSVGGLGLLCRQAPPVASQNGQPFWLEFALPGSPRLFAFAARMAFLQNLPAGGVLLGWSFYATDDNAAYLEQLQEIQRVLGMHAEARAMGDTLR